MAMTDIELFSRLGMALASGMLIGLERGWHERVADRAHGEQVAGIRTFGIIALLGAVTLLVGAGALVLSGLVFLGLAMVLGVNHVLAVQADRDFGITTVIAGLVTYVLGAVAMKGYLNVAASVAVVMATILSLKPVLHRWEARLDRKELFATFQLLLISVVMLPVLPDRGFGPWSALNPYELWWMVVLIAAISYVGYFGVKIAGPSRGLGITGLLGGMVSSTAVALDFSRLAREESGMHRYLAMGILVACATMFPRILLVSVLIHPPTALAMTPSLGAMALFCYAWAIVLWRRAGASHPDVEATGLRNPFEIRMALAFGLLLAVIVVLSHALKQWLGDAGVYLLAAVSGLSDVDAINVSLSRMAGGEGLAVSVAAHGVIVAAMVNTLVKAGITAVLGGRRFALETGVPLLIALGVGALVLVMA